MKITLLQSDIHWRDLSANCDEVHRLMDGAPDSDLYVLPEMWASGFEMHPDEALAAESRQALVWMERQARLRQCAIAGSLPWQTETTSVSPTPQWRNRFFFVKPDAPAVFYDKCHLFGYGGETAVYTAGSNLVDVTWHGIRFRLQVCFDLRFPETARNHAATPYDVLLYVANWPVSRRAAWDALLRARAIENQCYVVGVNRTGGTSPLLYDGGSAVIDAYGRTIAQLDAPPQTFTFTPDLDALQRFRAKFPVLL